MNAEYFVGDVKDVCAELKKDFERYGKISVGAWLKIRKAEKAEAEQFGISLEDFRKIVKKY